MPKITEVRKAERRRQILDAARAAFVEKGFAQASTGDVVARSGLSTGAVYSYFPSKNDLVVAVCEEAIDAVFGGGAPDDLGDLVARVPGRDHARLVAQIWAEAAVSPLLAARVRDQLARAREQAATLVRRVRAERGLSDTADAAGPAEAVLALLAGYALRLAVDADTDTEALRRALRAIIEAPAP